MLRSALGFQNSLRHDSFMLLQCFFHCCSWKKRLKIEKETQAAFAWLVKPSDNRSFCWITWALPWQPHLAPSPQPAQRSPLPPAASPHCSGLLNKLIRPLQHCLQTWESFVLSGKPKPVNDFSRESTVIPFASILFSFPEDILSKAAWAGEHSSQVDKEMSGFLPTYFQRRKMSLLGADIRWCS